MHICVVNFCKSTGRGRKGTRVHKFPERMPSICERWVSFVRVTKPDFPGPRLGMVVCEEHFNESDYMASDLRMARLGLRSIKRIRLKPDAVPSKYPDPPQWTIERIQEHNNITTHFVDFAARVSWAALLCSCLGLITDLYRGLWV